VPDPEELLYDELLRELEPDELLPL